MVDDTGTGPGRIIGIQHRVKKTAEGEPRPTMLFIKDGTETRSVTLEDDNAELDFVMSRFPTKWRKTEKTDDLSKLPPHHIKWRKLPKGELESDYPASHIKMVGESREIADKIPESYDGMERGDKFVMILGGSGDRFAFALANRGKKLDASVYRVPSFVFCDYRGERNKNDDAATLVEIYEQHPDAFYEVRQRDRDLIKVREMLLRRTEAMKAEIACGQRLRSRFIGSIFFSPDGQYPDGSIEDAFDAEKANDAILKVLKAERRTAERALSDACEGLDVYKNLFEPIEGVGPMIASRIIAAVADIRMFSTKAKLKAYMGAHVLKDGRFPRKRGGEVANWHPDARQALYLLADQFNRRPGTHWGKKLLEYKAKLRAKHPEPVIGENGKKKYTDGHIHKMAMWRTVSKFVEWLWANWWELEGRKNNSPTRLLPDPTNTRSTSTEEVSTTPESVAA